MNSQLQLLESTITNCQKQFIKAKPHSSQASLLTNRIKALEIARACMLQEATPYTLLELEQALPPLHSIANKCKHGIAKHQEGHPTYSRLSKIITTMNSSIAFIEHEIHTRTS